MVVLILPIDENQVKTKHVESLLVPRLDEGSIPSISTNGTQKAADLVQPPFVLRVSCGDYFW